MRKICTLCRCHVALYVMLWRDERGTDALCEECAALYGDALAV